MSAVDKQRGNNGKRLGGITGKGFMPGVCPNPNGRPKGPTLLTEIRELLSGKSGKERKAAAAAFVAQLKRGSISHAKEIIDREEGAVPIDGKVVVEFVLVKAPPADETPNPN